MDQDNPMQKKNPSVMPHDHPEPVPGLNPSSSPALSRSVQAQIGQEDRELGAIAGRLPAEPHLSPLGVGLSGDGGDELLHASDVDLAERGRPEDV